MTWATVAPALVMLAALAGVSVWVRRRFGAELPRPGTEIRLRGWRRLPAGPAVCLIEIDGERLLVGTGTDGVRVLHVWPSATVGARTEAEPEAESGGPA